MDGRQEPVATAGSWSSGNSGKRYGTCQRVPPEDGMGVFLFLEGCFGGVNSLTLLSCSWMFSCIPTARKKASKKPRAALHVFSVICLRASRGELLVVGGQGETPAPLPQAGGNYRTTTTTCCEVLSSRLSLTCTHRLSAGSPQ